MTRRTFASPREFEGLRELSPARPSFKPEGLWYGEEYEWLRWCLSQDFEPSKKHPYKYFYEIEIVEENVFDVRTQSSVRTLAHQFPGGGPIYVDWKKIGKNYGGVEVIPYSRDWFRASDPEWVETWDVGSGCIWHDKAIKSVKDISDDAFFQDYLQRRDQ